MLTHEWNGLADTTSESGRAGTVEGNRADSTPHRGDGKDKMEGTGRERDALP